jgi:hypothetical protein
MKSVKVLSSNGGGLSQMHTPVGGSLEPVREQEWQRAQRQILLYLHMLDIPAVETLELALEALRRAKEKDASTQTNPIADSMQAIRSLLLEQGYSSSDRETPSQECVKRRWLWPDISDQGGIMAMPALNRGFMSPRKR